MKEGTRLRDYKAFLFDLDGCLYYGDTPAPGADEVLAKLRSAGKKVAFVTNNSRQGADEVQIKLERMGISAYREEIVTATEYAGRFVCDRYGIATAIVIGSSMLQASVAAAGHRIRSFDCGEPVDVVVVGRDTEFTYDKLSAVIRYADDGARIVATNPDLFHPGAGGLKVPETGALTASVEAIIGSGRIEYVGKPAPYLLQYVMQLRGIGTAGDCVMIGDNYSTDMLGGMNAGMRTVWIAGDAAAKPWPDGVGSKSGGGRRPDWVVSGIADMVALLEG